MVPRRADRTGAAGHKAVAAFLSAGTLTGALAEVLPFLAHHDPMTHTHSIGRYTQPKAVKATVRDIESLKVAF
ncbi:MAG: hypothetical protein QOI78_1797, partial [Actinomycetota bacterium]|nr:hypothetical protein [Actinomycetota bacterium]